jgi:N-acyl-phosphatidylethanolamine-hydrolysing phospholipase D
LGNKKIVEDVGIAAEKIVEFDWWDAKQFAGVTITATPAQHWSARSLWDRNESLWSSWLIQFDNFTVWYSGDTGYNPFQFKEIGSKYKCIDLALISIGAYAPRWFMKDMHINPEEAVQIHQDIGSLYSLGVQWGTFVLTAEPLDEPPIKLKEVLHEKGIPEKEFETLKIGETKILKLKTHDLCN